MTVFSVHLANLPVITTLGLLLRPPSARSVPGMVHAECLTDMKLGASVFSPARLRLSRAVVCAAWESEGALDSFLAETRWGRRLARGWHVRLTLVRRWGHVRGLDQSPEPTAAAESAGPVVALTLARMKLPEVPRFIRWGRPVEALVRDHPGTTLALGALRLPRTVATFTCWRSEREMREMVLGHSAVPSPQRHAVAMVERERKDFHFEFTTLRFKPLSEHGEWEGRRDIVFGGRAQGAASLSR